MHANDVDGGKNDPRPDMGKDSNKSIGASKSRSRKEASETKSVKVITPSKGKDVNKLTPKVS